MGKSDPKSRSTAAKTEVSVKVFDLVFLPWTTFLILLHLLAMYVAPEHMWGVHFYHFYPVWLGWLLVSLSLIILVPGVSGFIYLKLEVLAKKVKKPFDSLGQNKSFLIPSLASLPVFWVLRNRLHLLGDGYFRITDLPEGRLHLQEWLDAFIHLVVYRVMIKLVPTWTPELTYSIISVLCGGAFVFLALKVSALLGKTGMGKVLIFAFLISLGSVQLFFGYVESYSILQAALLAYILFSARYLLQRASIFPALTAFVVSIGLHVTSLVFLPSFIYLLLRKERGRSGKKGSVAKTKWNPLVVGGLVLASCLVIFWVYIVATGLQKTGKGIFILPLISNESYSFGMFSLAHISEFVNQLLLLSPLGISLMVFFLFFKIKHREFRDRIVNFLILGVSFALIYLFAFNFTLGSADWDLMSMPAPSIGLLGIMLFLRWGEKSSAVGRPSSAAEGHSKTEKSSLQEGFTVGSPLGRRFGAWGLIFIWFSLFHTVPWVMINAHQQRSLDRYLLIQENDPHPVDETGYNLYKVARILEGAGLEDELQGLFSRAVERDPGDTISYYNLANWHHRRREYDQAAPILDTLLQMTAGYPQAHWLRGSIHIGKGEFAQALPHMEKASPHFQQRVDFLHQLWSVYHSTGQYQQAVACAQKMIKLEPENTNAHHLLALASIGLGDHRTAKQAWEQILIINPNDSRAIKSLKSLEESEQ